MCLFAALGLLAPRLVLLLIWFFNAAFILTPFSALAVPNPVTPVLGLVFLPTTTLGTAGRLLRSVGCRPSAVS